MTGEMVTNNENLIPQCLLDIFRLGAWLPWLVALEYCAGAVAAVGCEGLPGTCHGAAVGRAVGMVSAWGE